MIRTVRPLAMYFRSNPPTLLMLSAVNEWQFCNKCDFDSKPSLPIKLAQQQTTLKNHDRSSGCSVCEGVNLRLVDRPKPSRCRPRDRQQTSPGNEAPSIAAHMAPRRSIDENYTQFWFHPTSRKPTCNLRRFSALVSSLSCARATDSPSDNAISRSV